MSTPTEKDISDYYSDPRYASARWVHEVSESVAKVLQSFRPFCKGDVLVDYGCGPGLTVEKLFSSGTAMKQAAAAVGIDARICDISAASILRCRKRCPVSGVWCDLLNAFDSATTSTVSPQFLQWLPPNIHCAYSSLVAEYLSWPQVEALSCAVLDRLEDGGALAWFDWSEHPSYPPQHTHGIHQTTGVPKSRWLQLAAVVSEYVENSERRMRQNEGNHGSFLELPDSHVEVQVGSFRVQRAAEQRVPSSNVIHYFLLKKRSSVTYSPAVDSPEHGEARLVVGENTAVYMEG